jgi:hypothetical protein
LPGENEAEPLKLRRLIDKRQPTLVIDRGEGASEPAEEIPAP